jgi:hypothetical protein
MDIEVKVGALIMDPNSGSPIVVLRGVESEVVLPIWVGTYEANAIAWEIEKVVPQRPMTHDLIKNLLVQLDVKVERVTITELRDSTFYAVIQSVDGQGNQVSMDSRPSDAIALALRFDCPIFVTQEVIDLSGANIVESEESPVQTSDDWPEFIE